MPEANFTDLVDRALAMAAYCRKLVPTGEFDATSEAALLYLGAAAGNPILPPLFAPPSPSFCERQHRSPALGWHGIEVAAIEADYGLIAQLTPDCSAVKVLVDGSSPASRAGLRTGDYVVTIGQSGNAVPLTEFDRLHLPPFVQVIVRFHRPGRRRVADTELKILKLGRPPGLRRPRWWQDRPKGFLGREVQPGKDRAAFVGQMAEHPHIPNLAYRILCRLASYYDGKAGAFPAYSTLAADVGCKRRQTAIESVNALEWLGIVEIRRGAGVRYSNAADHRGGGVTNRFVLHWPEGWSARRKK